MILQEKIFSTVPGSTQVLSSGLKMVNLLKVKLDGLGYDIVYPPSTPGNRQVKYRNGVGSLDFQTSVPFTGAEKVYVLYKL